MQKTCLGLAALVLAALPAAASAQLPPELLGGGAQPSSKGQHSETFYKGKDGLWVLTRKPENDGYRCAVNFTSPTGLFIVHGPWDAEMGKKGVGMIWFDGKDIPTIAKAAPVKITVRSKDPTGTYPAIHTTIGKASNGVLILIVNMKKLLAETNETDDIAVDFGGKEVFQIHVVGLQDAYARLGACVAAKTG
jgi:hypothetical protein